MIALTLLGLLVGFQDPDIDALLKQLSDDSIEVREKATAALIDLGEKGEELVRKHHASAVGELKVRCEGILRAIGRSLKLGEVLPRLKRVTIDAKDSKLRDVLENVRRQSGMAMELEGIADATVSVQVMDATPLEAVDAVCKAAGLGWVIDGNKRMVARAVPAPEDRGPPMIHFQANRYVEVPRVFVRQFAVAPSSINVNRWTDFRSATSSATLQLRLMWTPETKPAAAWIEVTSVTDDRGRSILEPAKNPMRGKLGQTAETGGIRRSQSVHVVVLSGEVDAKAIASVRGTARLRFLKGEKTLAFDATKGPEPQKRELDGLTVETSEFKLFGDMYVVKFEFTGRQSSLDIVRSSLYPVRLRMEDGTTRPNEGLVVKEGGDRLSCVLTWPAVRTKVAAVEIVVESEWHTDSFDFELKDIPLPK